MGSLKDYQTLKSHKDFVRVYNRASKWHSKTLTLFYIEKPIKRVGFTVTKKVGNAVVRNRTKRRFRALFLDNMQSLKDGVYIFLAKPNIVEQEYKDLQRDFTYVLKKLKAYKTNQ